MGIIFEGFLNNLLMFFYEHPGSDGAGTLRDPCPPQTLDLDPGCVHVRECGLLTCGPTAQPRQSLCSSCLLFPLIGHFFFSMTSDRTCFTFVQFLILCFFSEISYGTGPGEGVIGPEMR